MRTKLILALAALLGACGPLVIGSPEPDPLDLTAPIRISGADSALVREAYSAVILAGGNPSSSAKGAYNLAIKVDPRCPCGTEHSCADSKNKVVILCPQVADMSKNQIRLAIWSAVAQTLWGTNPLPCEDASVLSPSRCRDADKLQTFTVADMTEICRHARGPACRGYPLP